MMDEKTMLAQSTARLEVLLEDAEAEDLEVLSRYNFDNDQELAPARLVQAIRENGGNDIGRRVWGAPHYLEIVRHVADRFSLAWTPAEDEASLERKLLAEIFRQSWSKMSPAQRQAVHDLFSGEGVDKERLSRALVEGSFSELMPTLGYVVAWNTARLVAAAAVGEAGALAGEGFLGGLAAQLLGPLGVVAGVVIFLIGLAGPAYRKIIPSVIQIAYIRCKAEAGRGRGPCADRPAD